MSLSSHGQQPARGSGTSHVTGSSPVRRTRDWRVSFIRLGLVLLRAYSLHLHPAIDRWVRVLVGARAGAGICRGTEILFEPLACMGCPQAGTCLLPTTRFHPMLTRWLLVCVRGSSTCLAHAIKGGQMGDRQDMGSIVSSLPPYWKHTSPAAGPPLVWRDAVYIVHRR